MESLNFLNITFPYLPGEKSSDPRDCFLFLYFPTEIFKFSFDPQCKIGWPTGYLGRVSHYLLWSDYKHHTNINILVCITPNGAISWVSLAYGGRASDAYIVRNSGFLDLLEFYDQMMTDKGFKIKTDLALKQCTLLYHLVHLLDARWFQGMSKKHLLRKMCTYM